MSALGCDFNWSMQHPDSHYREGGVENEAETKDLLRRLLASRRFDIVRDNQAIRRLAGRSGYA